MDTPATDRYPFLGECVAYLAILVILLLALLL